MWLCSAPVPRWPKNLHLNRGRPASSGHRADQAADALRCPTICPPPIVVATARWVTFEGVPDRKVAEVSPSSWVLLTAFIITGVIYVMIVRAVAEEVRDR